MGKEATSLAVQWLRIHLPMQGLWVQPLVRELKSHIPWGKLSHTLPLKKALHAAMKTSAANIYKKKKEEEGKLRVGAMERKISRKTGGKEMEVPSVTAPNRGVPPPLPTPAVDVALLISHGHCHSPDLAEVEVHVVLVVVRGDPAHPHAAGLLAGKDPHGVIVLGRQRGDQRSVPGPPWDS